MKKTRLKQGTLAWEKARSTRIGGSEVYDIVRYYATDEELQNCGINAEDFREEEPYTTAWALYHKIINDGVYKREVLPPELAEYGHAVEPYGVYYLQKNRKKKLRPGEVYINKKLVASLDISGIAEEVDSCETFSYGKGHPRIGERFVCEQKSMLPQKYKKAIPFKYIVQAQYQLEMTGADFFILQIMVLKEDTPFIRGKICQMSKPKRYKYLDDHMMVKNIYFRSNEHLGQLIKTCLDRFFEAVEKEEEPTAYIALDKQRNIIESIRLNSAFRPDAVIEDYDLSRFAKLRDNSEKCDNELREEMQKIVETAKEKNSVNFNGGNGITAKFDKIGRFLVKVPEDYEDEAKTVSE